MFEPFLYVCAGMSALTLFLYGWDKLCAKWNKRRIRESVLLTLPLLGGAVGALLGMLLFRHKTRHSYFWAVAFLGLVLEIAALLLLKKYFP